MTYDSDDVMSEKLALAIMAQARASVQPRRKNWGNPAPLFVLPGLQAIGMIAELTYMGLGRWLVLS